MKLTAELRDVTGKKVKQLRADGKLPAVVFGPVRESTNITVDTKEFGKLFAETGFNKFIDLEIAGEKKSSKVLVKEVQEDPLKDEFITVNFYQVDEDRQITVEVPIVLVGESPALKLNLGFLVQNLDSVAVNCLPKDVPNEFQVDMAALATTGDSITLEVIELGEGVEFDSGVEPTTAVAYIAARQKEIVVETTEEVEGEEGAEGETTGEESEASTQTEE